MLGDWVQVIGGNLVPIGSIGYVLWTGATGKEEPYAFVRLLSGENKAFYTADLLPLYDDEVKRIAIAKMALGLQ